MTIEDLPPAYRCPACGTWLPRGALDCPSCGRPRDLAMAGPASDPRRERRLRIATGLGATLALGAGIYLAFGTTGDVTPSPTPSPVAVVSASQSPSPSPRPTARPLPSRSAVPSGSPRPVPTPRPTPEPTPPQVRAPLSLPSSILDAGRRAIVTASGLRVREFWGLNATEILQLGAGSEVLLRVGPIPADGYDWYWVNYQPLGNEPALYDGGGQGWLAAGPVGDVSYLEIGEPRCPSVSVTIALISAMSELARIDCLGTTSFELSGMVEQCYEGPITPYEYEPAWLWFSCWYVVELGADRWLDIHFPPGLPQPDGFGRGDLVRIVGHVNDAAADDCQVIGAGPDAEPSAADQAYFEIECRASLVLSEIEVTGHIDLPDLY